LSRLLAALLGAMALGNVDIAVTNTATPAIHADLGATGGELELVVSGYTLAYAMLLITAARLGEMRGYRRMFLLGLAVVTAASLACGLAPAPVWLVVARLVQGAAAALMAAQVLTGIQLHFAGAARGRALGWYAAVLAGSAVVGQIAGGLLVSADLLGTGWRPIFLVNVPLGVLLLVLAARALPGDEPRVPQRLDATGVAVLTATLALLVLPLVLGRDEGWPAWTWASLAASAAGLAAFVAHERRAAARGGRPLVALEVFRSGTVSWGLLSAATATSTYFAILFTLALYLQQGLGRSPAYSGLALVSWVAAFGVAGPLLARVAPSARRLAAPAGALAMAVGFAGLAAGPTSAVVLVAMLGVGGLGFGAVFSGSLAQLTGAVGARHAPDISGLFNTASRVGGVVGVAAFGTLYLSLAPRGAVHAFTITALALAATVLAAGAAAGLAAHRGARPTALKNV
jgi:MFS family permease